MLTELCAYLKNYFLRDYLNPDAYIHHGTFAITNGQVQDLPFLQAGQFFRVIGSVFNDGVWQYRPESESQQMHDETFDGTIWAMSVDPAFLRLADEISAWIVDNASSINSPFSSESFGSGGYSYTKKRGGGSATTGTETFGWQDQFASRLAKYKRFTEL